MSTVLTASAQEEPRLGADGRPLLNKPKLELCKERKFHEKYGNHHYFLSWKEPWNKFEVRNNYWLEYLTWIFHKDNVQ